MTLLSPKLWFLWLRAGLGLFWGSVGVAHGGVLGPLGSGCLHHAVSFSFRGLDKKFESSISKTLGNSDVKKSGTGIKSVMFIYTPFLNK